MLGMPQVISLFAFALFGFAPLASAQQAAPTATVRVVPIPIANYTPLLVAREKGFFSEEKLEVTWAPVAQGAIAIQAVFGGSAEVGGSAVFEPMVARGNGLDLVFLAAGVQIRRAPPDNSALLVRTEDTIRQPTHLAGKKISAGLLNSVNYVHMQEWLQKKGVDRTGIEFLEIPFPQMADALFQKRVDAVWNVEPFVTFMMKSGKAHLLAYPYQDNLPGMDISNYFAKESWVRANPDVARRFRRAIDRATKYLADASKEERDDWVAKFTGMRLEVVREVTLPVYSTEFNVPSLQYHLDLAVKHKLLTRSLDINAMIFQP